MRICAFTGCHNGDYKLKKWCGQKCDAHGCYRDDDECSCPRPFRLFPFPSASTNHETRLEWIRLVHRRDPKTGKNWLPKDDDRICSEHFVDGCPTEKNPYPTLKLPAGVRPRKARPPPTVRKEPRKKKPKEDINDEETETIHETAPNYDYDYSHLCLCPATGDCSCGVQLELKHSINKLIQQYDELQEKINNPKPETVKKVDKTLKFLQTNEKTKFYTGLPSKAAFLDLLRHTSNKAARMRSWQGDKKARVSSTPRRAFKKTPVKFGVKRKLTMKEELLIVLMKLRLGLLNQVLADMFGISFASVSVIFNTWIKLLAAELHPLVFYPDKFIIRENLPDQLKHYPRLRCTLDCTEIFIDRPRHLKLQALTWSDYKNHNTIKFLVGIAPNGHISFLSPTWGGRTSDQHIVRESGFLDLVEPGDLIMADRGFTIREDLMLCGATLEIPPASSGLEQMSRKMYLRQKL